MDKELSKFRAGDDVTISALVTGVTLDKIKRQATLRLKLAGRVEEIHIDSSVVVTHHPPPIMAGDEVRPVNSTTTTEVGALVAVSGGEGWVRWKSRGAMSTWLLGDLERV